MTADQVCELIDKFGNAALRAGQSNSGYAIDACAHDDWKQMQTLRNELKDAIRQIARREVDRMELAVTPNKGE